MKRLTDLIDAELAKLGLAHPVDAPSDEVAAGLVGAVQEWLTQPQVVAEAEVNGWPASTEGARRMLDGLRKQAGEGLDS